VGKGEAEAMALTLNEKAQLVGIDERSQTGAFGVRVGP